MPSHYRDEDIAMRIKFLDFLLHHSVDEDFKADESEYPAWWFDVLRLYEQEIGSKSWLDTIEQAVDKLAELYLKTGREELRFVMQYKIAQDLEI